MQDDNAVMYWNPFEGLKMRRFAVAMIAVIAGCGGSTEPKPAIVGTWSGTVGAVGSRAAADVELHVLPNGSGTFDGTAVIAIGRDSSIYINVSAVPLANDSVSVLLSDTSILHQPTITIRGRIAGSVMDARIDGGRFVNDQLTLSHTQ